MPNILEESQQYLKELGEQLEKNKCGKIIESQFDPKILNVLYYRVPPSIDLVVLRPGVVVMQNSELLRTLCEMCDAAAGIGSTWNCKKKSQGRLQARCDRAGSGAMSRSNGMRSRMSKKVGCLASVTTVHLSRESKSTERKELAHAVLLVLEDLEEDCIVEGTEKELCLLTTVKLDHNEHSVQELPGRRRLISRSEELLSLPDVRHSLETFHKISSKGRGSIMKACKYLEETFTNYRIPEQTVRNAIASLKCGEDDASDLVRHLKNQRDQGIIQYLDILLDHDTGVLNSVTWAYSGSIEIVKRCGELCFWDSTHNTTRYSFKLATFTVVDSEGSSRAVLLSLNLEETAEACKNMLVNWHKAFDCKLPGVIFTDGDDGMHVAISSVPYYEHIKHLTCVFHLFDMNVKRKIQPILLSSAGSSSWPGFRKALSICREAGSELELNRLWSGLMEEWIPESKTTSNARQYMQRYIWSKRKQWATFYFKDSFTMGSSTTQRAESWNSLIKCFVEDQNLKGLTESIRDLVHRQGKMEGKSQDALVRVSPLRKLPFVSQSILLKKISDSLLSKYACTELGKELSAAERMAVTIRNADEELFPGGLRNISNNIERSGTAHYVYGSGSEMDSITNVSVSFTYSKSYNESDISTKNLTSTVTCECLYPTRMKLPCRHSIAICMHLDRSLDSEVSFFMSNGHHKTTVECILMTVPNWRWRIPTKESSSVTLPTCDKTQSEVMKFELSDVEERNESITRIEKEIDVWMGGYSHNLSCSNLNFPSEIGSGGGRIAYSTLMTTFRAISETCTESNELLECGRHLCRFMNQLRKGLSSFRHDRESFKGRTQDYFEMLMRNSLSADDFQVERRKRKEDIAFRSIGRKVSTIIFSDSESESKILTRSPSSFQGSEKLKSRHLSKKEYKHPPLRADVEQCDEPTNDCTIQVMNPARRADTRRTNATTLNSAKTREARMRKKDSSRRAPISSRLSCEKESRIPKKPQIAGYACPLCNAIGLQNNPSNVRQHFMSKHDPNAEYAPSLDAMVTAAQLLSRTAPISIEESISLEVKVLKDSPNTCQLEEGKRIITTSKKTKDTCIDSGHAAKKRKISPRNEFPKMNNLDESFVPIKERELIPLNSPDCEKFGKMVTRNVTEVPNTSDLNIGSSIEVLWKQDLSWFPACLTAILKSDGQKFPITLLYDDGYQEDLTDLMEHRWRIIRNYDSFPLVSWRVNDSTSKCFHRIMDQVTELETSGKFKDVLVGEGPYPILASDFSSLQDQHWISDAVIESFSRTLMNYSVHKENKRISFISPQAIVLLETDRNKHGLLTWLRGLHLHDIDLIIWPIHCSSAQHWNLCVAFTDSRVAVIIDPYHPRKRIGDRRICALVLSGLEIMSSPYTTYFKDNKKWKLGSPSDISQSHGFPEQPTGNFNDCGVLVCLYIWSIFVGDAWSSVESGIATGSNVLYSGQKNDFSSIMMLSRMNIGGMIASAIPDRKITKPRWKKS